MHDGSTQGIGGVALQRLTCEECGSELVQPTRLDAAGADLWLLSLRCPECGWTRSAIFPTDQIEAIEEELDRGYDLLVGQLADLVRSNMSDYVDRFTAALATDAIQPMDF